MEKQKKNLVHNEDDICIVTGVPKTYPLSTIDQAKEKQTHTPSEGGYLD